MRPWIDAASPLPSTMVVSSLVMVTTLGGAEEGLVHVLKLDAQVFGDELAGGQHGDVFQHGLAAIAEAGGLDGDDVERAAQLVDDQGRQRLAVHVLGDDQQGPALRTTLSSTGSRSWTLEIFFSNRSGCTGLQHVASSRSASVTK